MHGQSKNGATRMIAQSVEHFSLTRPTECLSRKPTKERNGRAVVLGLGIVVMLGLSLWPLDLLADHLKPLTGPEPARGVALTISPDGRDVYVGALNSLRHHSRDQTTGRLSPAEADVNANGIIEIETLVMSPDGRYIYAGGRGVAIFVRDRTTGEVQYKETQMPESAFDFRSSLAVSPDGSHLYAADGSLKVLTRHRKTGRLTLVQTPSFEGSAYAVAVSPDGRYVYVGGNRAVGTYARNQATGRLYQEDIFGLIPYATIILLSPDGRDAYVFSRTEHYVLWAHRDIWTGRLTINNVLYDNDSASPTPGVFGLKRADSAAFNPNGAYFYVASAEEDGVAVFRRDNSGAIAYLEGHYFFQEDGSPGLFNASAVAVSPEETHTYVISPSGGLTFANSVSGQCSDGIDNDGDFRVDSRDPGCADPNDGSERDSTLDCDDGLDNDGDGFADFPRDPACASPASPSEHSECQDGRDNDRDGSIDYDGGASWNGGRPIASPDSQCTRQLSGIEKPVAEKVVVPRRLDSLRE